MNIKQAKWIKAGFSANEGCPIFKKDFSVGNDFISARLDITAQGVYKSELNGKRIGNFILAPGFTSYRTRLQYQSYDVTEYLKEENVLTVTAGYGWYCGYLAWEGKRNHWGKEPAILAVLTVTYPDRVEIISTDESWHTAHSAILNAEIYNGETVDARITPVFDEYAVFTGDCTDAVIPQEGEYVTEHERIKPIGIFKDNNGDTVVDFGQNLVGYVEFTTDAKDGDKVSYSHGEIIDKDGNFYNDNLRTADQKISYICKKGKQTYKPNFTFMGFRYIRVEEAPENIDFTAIVVHSDIRRTGAFECGHEKINKLYSNIIWGQKSNFLDIPTDCPQRDERLGWTGDAQVFIRTASYNFDVEKFFLKWLNDLGTDQLKNGSIPHVIPDLLDNNDGSSAWGDAVTICPWQLYLTYGNRRVLRRFFENMKRWVYFSQNSNRMHFGDWLAKDTHEAPTQEIVVPTPEDPLKGRSSQRLISDAFNLYSTELLIKTGEVLGEDMEDYKKIYEDRRNDFRKKYKYRTQTEHTLALYFNLAENSEKTAE